jgi:hypothetical protein
MPEIFISKILKKIKIYCFLLINRLLLKTPWGIKVIHRPYHASIFSNNNYQDIKVNDTFSILNKVSKLKILTYPWHISHQYELYKLGHHFTLITDGGSWHTTGWNFDYRPISPNVEFKSIREINVKDYDLAILHFDENVLTPQNCNGKVNLDWGETFKFFREKIDLPKIAICHGTPQFYGQYNIDYDQSNLLEIIESERLKLVNYLDDILVITNSYQAETEWQFQNSKVIWHGFDSNEFPLTTYAKMILSPLGKDITLRPHYRGHQIYQEVFQDFPLEYLPSDLKILSPSSELTGNAYAKEKFKNYVDNIRQYSIYFNSTIRSPMPRSRGEAMMCGLVTVSLRNHDVDLFIENGINGFYADTAPELREILLYLLNHPTETQEIGKKGRQLAMKIFSSERFLDDWRKTISSLLEN